MKRFGVLGMMASAFVAGAGTVYVDCNLSDYAGHDGSSWEKAFKTIQEGVDKAVTDDIVLVAPGWYDQGGTTLGSTDAYLTNRVTIAGKRITLKSKNGRDSRDTTFIVGRHATVAEDPDGFGMGLDAIRCMRLDFTDSVHGTVVVGFTLVNGATHYNGKSYAMCSIGGGVNFGNRTTTASKASYLVDCVVSNCVATRGGGIYFGNAVRTRFVDNAAPVNGTALRDANIYYCLIDGANKGSGGAAYLGGTKAVNCTIANCPVVGVRGNSILSGASYSPGVFLNSVALQYAGGSSCDIAVTNSVIASNCDYYWGDNAASGFATNNCRSVGMNSYQFISTATGDFRPLSTGDLVGAGAAEHLLLIPEQYRYTDYAGNTVPQTGAITVGAITQTETPTGGVIYFTNIGFHGFNMCSLFVDGYEHCVDRLYSFGMSYPAPHRLDFVMPSNPALVAKRHFFGCCYNLNSVSATYGFPLRGTTTCYMMGPPTVGDVLTVAPYVTENVFWADPSVADGAEMDGTEAKPYNTLQGAMDAACAAKSYCVIYAKKGRYDKGGKLYGGITNRVALTTSGVYVRLYAVEGPERTFIVGQGDESSTHAYKYGPAAVRCVATCTSCAQVSGFTLTDGRVSLNNGSETTGADCLYGGAVYCGNSPSYFQVEDCIITNCAASRGAIAWRGVLRRCRAVDCITTTMGALRGGVYASACVFKNIRSATSGDHVVGMIDFAANCDFLDLTDGGTRYLANYAGSGVYNSLVFNSAYLSATPNSAVAGVYYDQCTTVEDAVASRAGLIAAKMGFADAAAGDYALYSSSKAATGGNVNNGDANFWRLGSVVDIEGTPYVFGADGSVVVGAYQRTKPSTTVTVSVTGAKDAVSPAAGEYFVTAETPLTLTATAAETRNFQGFYSGENCISTEATFAYSFAAANAGQAVDLVARYVPYWYVDPTASDANSGRDWAHAKRTLAGVMTLVQPGDTVYAAPGVYDEGSMINPQNYLFYSTPQLRTRVFVTNNVALVSREGAATTIIKGQSATTSTDGFGGGADALRCVYLARGARLEGFTLSGGRGLGENLDNPDDNNRGAGVHGWGDDAPEVRDCIITNCVATRGGGSVYVTAVNCRYLDNRATRLCAASQHTAHHNCYIDYNKGSPTVGYWRDMRNSTIGAHNDTATTIGTSTRSGIVQQPAMYNTLILAGRMTSAADVAFTNCAFTTDMLTGWPSTATTNETCVCAPPEMLQADDEGRPLVGCNLAIDKGDTNYVNWARIGTTDMDGNPRCVNGLKMDIGCYEADWKARYADDLGGRHLAVTAASPAVEETDTRTVALVDGTTLTLTMANPKARRAIQEVQFRVTGAGTLNLVAAGETLSYTATGAVQTYSFRSQEPSRELQFSFAGDGQAELLLGRMDAGMVLNIR